MAVVKIKDITIGDGMPKICVPLMGKTDEELLRQAVSVSHCGCDMVELRMDYYQEIGNFDKIHTTLAQIRQILNMPILLTFRTLTEGGEQFITPEDYKKLYEVVIAEGNVDLIDLELNLGESLLTPLIKQARDKGIKVILSNHDFQTTPATKEIIDRLVKMQKLQADIVKIAVMPRTKLDTLRLIEATLYMEENHNSTPVVAISMGTPGMPSRILGGWSGSAITFGVEGQASAPGQLSVLALKKIFTELYMNS